MTSHQPGEATTYYVARLGHLPRCHLAESPRWDGSSWWWLDATDGRVWSGTPGRDGSFAADERHHFGERTSLVHHTPATRGSHVTLVGEVARWWQGRNLLTTNRIPSEGETFNDGTVDSTGRLIVGTVHPDRQSGRLLRVEHDGSVTVLRSGFALSNGMAWLSPTELWHADSQTRTVWLHDLASGESEVFLDEESFGPGMPDGMCTTVDGSLWIAAYGTGEARRFDRTGARTATITVPTPQVTSISVGGLLDKHVLITTAREGHAAADDLADPGAGHLWLAEPGPIPTSHP